MSLKISHVFKKVCNPNTVRVCSSSNESRIILKCRPTTQEVLIQPFSTNTFLCYIQYMFKYNWIILRHQAKLHRVLKSPAPRHEPFQQWRRSRTNAKIGHIQIKSFRTKVFAGHHLQRYDRAQTQVSAPTAWGWFPAHAVELPPVSAVAETAAFGRNRRAAGSDPQYLASPPYHRCPLGTSQCR